MNSFLSKPLLDISDSSLLLLEHCDVLPANRVTSYLPHSKCGAQGVVLAPDVARLRSNSSLEDAQQMFGVEQRGIVVIPGATYRLSLNLTVIGLDSVHSGVGVSFQPCISEDARTDAEDDGDSDSWYLLASECITSQTSKVLFEFVVPRHVRSLTLSLALAPWALLSPSAQVALLWETGTGARLDLLHPPSVLSHLLDAILSTPTPFFERILLLHESGSATWLEQMRQLWNSLRPAQLASNSLSSYCEVWPSQSPQPTATMSKSIDLSLLSTSSLSSGATSSPIRFFSQAPLTCADTLRSITHYAEQRELPLQSLLIISDMDIPTAAFFQSIVDLAKQRDFQLQQRLISIASPAINGFNPSPVATPKLSKRPLPLLSHGRTSDSTTNTNLTNELTTNAPFILSHKRHPATPGLSHRRTKTALFGSSTPPPASSPTPYSSDTMLSNLYPSPASSPNPITRTRISASPSSSSSSSSPYSWDSPSPPPTLPLQAETHIWASATSFTSMPPLGFRRSAELSLASLVNRFVREYTGADGLLWGEQVNMQPVQRAPSAMIVRKHAHQNGFVQAL